MRAAWRWADEGMQSEALHGATSEGFDTAVSVLRSGENECLPLYIAVRRTAQARWVDTQHASAGERVAGRVVPQLPVLWVDAHVWFDVISAHSQKGQVGLKVHSSRCATTSLPESGRAGSA
jgi:hypothetical protein